MMVMIVVVTFFRSRKALIAMGIGAILAVFIFLPWWEGRFSNEYNESGGNRLAKWEFIFSQPFVQNHILFGTGPGGYARYFMTYFPNNAASTHSNYIDIFLQVGIVGSLIFVWMIAALAWDWWTLFSTKWKNPFLQGYYYTTIGGLAAILVAMFLGDWFTPFVFNQTLQGFSWTVQNWVFLGGMLALPEILRKQQERVENPATH